MMMTMSDCAIQPIAVANRHIPQAINCNLFFFSIFFGFIWTIVPIFNCYRFYYRRNVSAKYPVTIFWRQSFWLIWDILCVDYSVILSLWRHFLFVPAELGYIISLPDTGIELTTTSRYEVIFCYSLGIVIEDMKWSRYRRLSLRLLITSWP